MWLVICFIIFVFIRQFFCWQRQWAVNRWRRKLNLAAHQSIYNELYSVVNGFALSQRARQNGDAVEYVYGEIDFESFIALLSLCNVDQTTRFYDLGSGTGKAVLACAIVFPVKVSCGVELLTELYQCSKKQVNRLAKWPDYAEQVKHIHFINSNFLTVPLNDATHIFINATSFFGDLWQRISDHVEQINDGMIVISTSKKIKSKKFIVIRIVPVKMSWGIVEAYIQQRLPNFKNDIDTENCTTVN